MTGLRFDRAEIEARIAKARGLLGERGLSALLVFAPESHYYLTGYDSTGYLFFQAALLCADDEPVVVLTRRPDLQQAKETSVITDIRIWYNTEDANPALDHPISTRIASARAWRPSCRACAGRCPTTPSSPPT